MLKCIHYYSTKQERRDAFNTYRKWKKDQFYTHLTFDENGNPRQTPCTRYVKHAETSLKRQQLLKLVTLSSTKRLESFHFMLCSIPQRANSSSWNFPFFLKREIVNPLCLY